MLSEYALAAAAIAALWACCAFLPREVRRATIDGLRCLGRHADLWRIPANFALGYAVFQLAAAALFHWRMEDLLSWIVQLSPQPSPRPLSLLAANLPGSAERTASIFTIFTATFPLSAIFAMLLLGNFRGLLAEMIRSLRRRFGLFRAALLSTALAVAAVCAAARPALYLLLPELNERTPLAVTLGMDFFSFVFELLLGIFFLTYLMLMAYAWMRGLHFERTKLFHVAMRRTAFVLKWSLPLTALAALLVVLPSYAALLADGDIAAASTWFSVTIGIPLVIAIALFFCPAQATLVFHNESLRGALLDSRRLLAAHWRPILPFLAAAASLFLLQASLADYVNVRLGAETCAALAAAIPLAGVEAFLTGWFIASWICLYKTLAAGRKEIPF